MTDERQRTGRRVPRPLVMAHRGGAGLWPENTLYAFERAAALGADVLEVDVHATAEGVPVIIHDPTTDRTTDGRGPVGALPLSELKGLDAAYRWSPDGGRDFPLRGRHVTVPTLGEALAAFPALGFNIDIKQASPPIVDAVCRVIREAGAAGRVVVASFDQRTLDAFRRSCEGVATAAGPAELRAFLARAAPWPEGLSNPAPRALQVPDFGARLLSPELIAAAHRHSLEVHAWTINDESAMRRLLDYGIDGIITDYPDRLLALLGGGA